MAASQVCVRKTFSWNSKCYWKTKDWNLLVFWSLPQVFTDCNAALDSHSWSVPHSSGALHRCGVSHTAFVQLLNLAFPSLPLLKTEALSAMGCSIAFGTLHDWYFFLLAIMHRHTSCNKHRPEVLIVQRNKRDSGRGNWVTEEFHSLLVGKILCF